MSEWSPASIEVAIQKCAERISDGVMKTDIAYRAYLQADHAYDLAYAKAFLTAEGSVDARKYQAELSTENERAARDVADAAYRLCEKTGKAIHAELDAYRSIGTSVRQAYAVAGRGEGL